MTERKDGWCSVHGHVNFGARTYCPFCTEAERCICPSDCPKHPEA